MDAEKLQQFFFWCMLVNSGVYAVTAIAILAFGDLICKMNQKMFKLDEATVSQSMQRYLANYKLLITAFNFAPWIAIMIAT
jgi:hypothetical protein